MDNITKVYQKEIDIDLIDIDYWPVFHHEGSYYSFNKKHFGSKDVYYQKTELISLI